VNPLLAIDSSQGTAVAVLDGTRVLASLYEENTMRHAEQVGLLISQALREAKLAPREINAVAVGVGPAPFTGLRVGIAAAKLFSEGVDAPLFGVSSLEALAYPLELDQETLVLTDARRGEVYFALVKGKSRNGAPSLQLGPGVKKLTELESELEGIKYLKHSSQMNASWVGLLAFAKMADGDLRKGAVANYLRAPDAVPSKGKKVSG
jgi:tRNA threonylcarbamoyladenosine biosynthesis protein TsaB